MISMVYDPACETVRCAWRNERFVLGGFSASSWAEALWRGRPGRPCPIGALRHENGGSSLPASKAGWAVTKVHRSALKIMKSLRRVTLCALRKPGRRPADVEAGERSGEFNLFGWRDAFAGAPIPQQPLAARWIARFERLARRDPVGAKMAKALPEF